MRIGSIEVHKISLKFPEPLTISFHTFHCSENYFVKFTSDSDLVGWGEGAPFKLITGDSDDDVKHELEKLEILKRKDFTSPDQIITTLRFNSPTLLAACDIAIHDLCAKAQNIPAYKLFTKAPRRIPNSVTVFLKEDVESTVKETRRILSLYPELEVLKIKLRGEGDIERCRAIRHVSPGDMKFVLDANQGYKDPEKAVQELNEIISLLGTVLLIEEPCIKHNHTKSRFVKDRIKHSKIFADESCCSMEDLENIIREKAFDGINIKLQKAGGIYHSRLLAKRAAEAGLSVMVGQMFETPLSTAASLLVAATCENIVLTDLDMDLELPAFSSGKTDFHDGYRSPVEHPGFAFDFDMEKLRALELEGLCAVEQWM